MGSDKANLAHAGIEMATYGARLLSSLFTEVLLVGGRAPEAAPGVRVPDAAGAARAPLAGLVTALSAASTERILVLATDLPLMTPDVLLGLVAWPGADAVVPRTADGPQPLCALYRKEAVLGVARAQLEAGAFSMRGVLEKLETVYLSPEEMERLDPAGTAFLNVNTPEDWERAVEHLGGAR